MCLCLPAAALADLWVWYETETVRGQFVTPETEGYTRHRDLHEDLTYEEFLDGELVRSGTYEVSEFWYQLSPNEWFVLEYYQHSNRRRGDGFRIQYCRRTGLVTLLWHGFRVSRAILSLREICAGRQRCHGASDLERRKGALSLNAAAKSAAASF